MSRLREAVVQWPDRAAEAQSLKRMVHSLALRSRTAVGDAVWRAAQEKEGRERSVAEGAQNRGKTRPTVPAALCEPA